MIKTFIADLATIGSVVRVLSPYANLEIIPSCQPGKVRVYAEPYYVDDMKIALQDLEDYHYIEKVRSTRFK